MFHTRFLTLFLGLAITLCRFISFGQSGRWKVEEFTPSIVKVTYFTAQYKTGENISNAVNLRPKKVSTIP